MNVTNMCNHWYQSKFAIHVSKYHMSENITSITIIKSWNHIVL